MQAVIRCTLGISWPHSRMASPLHICCASDAKAGPWLAESAVAAKAMAEKSAALLVRRKIIDAFPKVAARGAGRCSFGGAARGLRCRTRHPSLRGSPGVVARILPMFESTVLRRPASNYAPMIRSCNGLLQHFFDCGVHATSIAASESVGGDWMRRPLAWRTLFEESSRGARGLLHRCRSNQFAAPSLPRLKVGLARTAAIPEGSRRGRCAARLRPPPGPRPALQNSVEMRKFQAPEQPPVREAGVPSAAVAQTRPPRDGTAATREALGTVGVRA